MECDRGWASVPCIVTRQVTTSAKDTPLAAHLTRSIDIMAGSCEPVSRIFPLQVSRIAVYTET